MSLIRDVANELLGMFLADARLTGAVLLLVCAAALLVDAEQIDPLVGGAGLLVGCLLILMAVTTAAARRD